MPHGIHDEAERVSVCDDSVRRKNNRAKTLRRKEKEYYLTDDDSIKIGDTITVSTDDGTSEGIVIGVKKLSEMTEEEFPKENTWILTKEDNDG